MSAQNLLLPHTMDDVAKLLAGVLSPEQARAFLHTFDRKGLNPVTFAALKGAETSDRLLALLQLLEPPEAQEQSQMDQVVGLLEQIAASQTRVEESVARQEHLLQQIVSALGGKPKVSLARSPAAATRSRA